MTAMLLLDFFEEVYRKLRMQDASRGAVEQYTVCISRFAKHLGRRPALSDLTDGVVADWISAMVNAGLARRTINGRLNMLLALWRLAKRKRLIDTDLDLVSRLKAPKRLPQAWTTEQMARIIESCRQAQGRFLGVPCDLWWPALVLTIYDTGLRLSSALSIRFDEIDFRRKVLRVPAERMKNNVEQTFVLTDQTVEAIMATVPPRRVLLFPYPSKWRKEIFGRFKVILIRAGLPASRRDLFHKIRRTTATHIAAAAGESAAIRQLGHQDSATIKRYIDPTFLAAHDLAKHLERPGWKDPKQLEVQFVNGNSPSPQVVRVRRSLDDFSGKHGDLFAQLAAKQVLTAENVAEALDTLGILYRDFARLAEISPSRFAAKLNGKRRFTSQEERRIRVALGLSYQHGEQVPEGPRNRKRDKKELTT